MFLFILVLKSIFFFFFNDTATTEIYTLSLHDALPISQQVFDLVGRQCLVDGHRDQSGVQDRQVGDQDRKSTRLNSSHSQISYAVFCLKKKKKHHNYIFTHVMRMHTLSSYIALHSPAAS